MVWFRRDLRLDDNPAWAAATARHDEVAAVFVLESSLLRSSGSIRRDQLFGHLHALDDRLRSIGGSLSIRSGPAVEAIPAVLADCGASALYLNADVSSFATRRDRSVAEVIDCDLRVFHGLTVHEPGSVLTRAGTLSKVFSPFFKTWSAAPLSPWPVAGTGRPRSIPGELLPTPGGTIRQVPGEAAAWDRVNDWLERVDDYPGSRDVLSAHGTSELSSDLKFGTMSARTLVDVIGTSTPGRAAFVRQLAWRDWWAHTLAIRPDLPTTALRERYDGIAWRNDEHGFDRWCAGETGYPVVDAGMRQLASSGWMHNRARMICASFLVKDLLIDWRKGERFFRHHLVDADVAQNAGNWQWVAGTGPDAAPYFRVFNPTRQGERFDPGGDYVRRWVPELAGLSSPAIHEPETVAPLDLAEAGVVLGDTYPAPIVNHAYARDRALAAYKAAVA